MAQYRLTARRALLSFVIASLLIIFLGATVTVVHSGPSKVKVVFIGSSSIARWIRIHKDFPGYEVSKYGISGSHYTDLPAVVKQHVVRERPDRIVIYSGDNDLAAGKSPQTVASDAAELIRLIHSHLGDTHIFMISIKPSLARIRLLRLQRKTNALLNQLASKDKRVHFINVADPMLGPDNRPIARYYQPDRLHLTREGYELWARLIKRAFYRSSNVE